jgi:tight adherence protein B
MFPEPPLLAFIAQVSFNLETILLFALPLIGSVVLAYGVTQVVGDLRKSEKKHLLNRLRGGAQRRNGGSQAFDPSQFRRQAEQAGGMMGNFFANLSFTAKLQTVLDQADVRKSASKVLVNLTAVAIVLVAGMQLVGLSILVSLGVGALAFVLPILYLYRKRKKRLNKLVEQLPDVFELLSQALRAGHSLASGMQLISTQVPEPAGTEFARVFHEQNLGLKIEDALKNLAERTDMLDVRFFVTAVLIQRQTGGDLAEVLDKIGGVIRDRIKLFGTVQALTAEGRLSGYVLLALPPLVFGVMMFINREYALMLIDDPRGRMMLTTAGTMQLMGWAMIKKIVNIKV